MEFRKTVTMTLYVRQQKRHRCKEQTFGLCGRKGGGQHLAKFVILSETESLIFNFIA